MTTFLLIRHGERDTPDDLLPGRTLRIQLTDRGRTQAERIAAHLAGERIDQIVSSPLERALETAAPLAREKKLVAQPMAAFSEMDFGEWTGKRFPELEAIPRWKQFNQFRSGTSAPGGESMGAVQMRFVHELLRLRDAFPDQCIACFSHADPIKAAVIFFLGVPLDFILRLEISVGSITVLELADWGARLVRLNEVPRV